MKKPLEPKSHVETHVSGSTGEGISPASHSSHSKGEAELLHMKSTFDLRKLALPVLLRQQRPIRSSVIATIVSLLLVLLFCFGAVVLALATQAFLLFVAWGGVIFGVVTGKIFNRIGRTFQSRYTRLAGFIAVASWFLFYICFVLLIPRDAPYNIIATIILFSRCIAADVKPFDGNNIILFLDIFFAYFIGSTLARRRFTRNDLYNAAKQAVPKVTEQV